MADNVNENNTTEEPKESTRTRFTLLVDNIFEVDDGGVSLVGNLHGKIEKGDDIYIIHPKFPQGIKAVADTLVVDGELPDEAENDRTAVIVSSITDSKSIPKFSVISNVPPQPTPDPNLPVENPFMVGMSVEYNRFIKDNEFTYTFMAALLTSRYLTPAVLRRTEPTTEGGASQTKVAFKLIAHPNDKSVHVLPLFTDMASLGLWKGILEGDAEGNVPNRLLLPFERAAEVGLANGGIVINPFGPAAVFVSKANIQNTLEMGRQVRERAQQMRKNEENKENKENE